MNYYDKKIISFSLKSINSFDYETCAKKLNMARVKAVHLDIMDCSVTQSVGLDPNVSRLFSNKTIVDFHIMSSNPLNYLKIIKCNDNVYVHTHLSMCRNYFKFIRTAKKYYLNTGISLNLNDDVMEIKKFLPYLKWINFMSVKKIGLTKQKFDIKVYKNIKKFKFFYPSVKNLILSVDGSVREEHLEKLSKLVNVIVVGSILYSSNSNFKKRYQELQKMTNVNF